MNHLQRPHSNRYMANVRLVTERVRTVERLLTVVSFFCCLVPCYKEGMSTNLQIWIWIVAFLSSLYQVSKAFPPRQEHHS